MALPVRYLTSVVNTSRIKLNMGTENLAFESPTSWGGPGDDDLGTSEVHFSDTISSDLVTGVVLKGVPATGGVETLYHECAHAYMLNNDLDERGFYKDAFDHYDKKTGLKPSQLKRLTYEAVGEYVGHKAGAAWRVIWSTIRIDGYYSKYSSEGIRAIGGFENFERVLFKPYRAIPSKFNRKLERDVFGYYMVGDEEVHTKTRMPQKLRSFCDETFLENKIQPQFTDNKFLSDRYSRTLSKINEMKRANSGSKLFLLGNLGWKALGTGASQLGRGVRGSARIPVGGGVRGSARIPGPSGRH